MNIDTGEIVDLSPSLRAALAVVPTQKVFTPTFVLPGIIERLEAKQLGRCNYDPVAVADEMLTRHEQGPLVELRGNPDPSCPECKGKGAAGGGKGIDGKFHPCGCCAMPLHWCNVHERPATHLVERLGPDRGKPCCDPLLGGRAMPCECVGLTGIAELFTE